MIQISNKNHDINHFKSLKVKLHIFSVNVMAVFSLQSIIRIQCTIPCLLNLFCWLH